MIIADPASSPCMPVGSYCFYFLHKRFGILLGISFVLEQDGKVGACACGVLHESNNRGVAHMNGIIIIFT